MACQLITPFAESLHARAFPPLNLPSRPKITAAAFFSVVAMPNPSHKPEAVESLFNAYRTPPCQILPFGWNVGVLLPFRPPSAAPCFQRLAPC